MLLDRRVLEHEAHIWLTSPEILSDEVVVERCGELLSAEEKAHLGQIGSARVRRQYLVSRALVRSTLSRYLPVAPEDWTFETRAGGRPEIVEPSATGLRFNLSHTRGLVACLVTAEIDAGIDLENAARTLDVEGLAGRRFAAEEAAALAACPVGERLRHFFGLWTLKEAYLKACGHGITLPLRSVVVSITEEGRLRVRFDPPLEDRVEDWQLCLFELSSSRLLAVALRRGDGADRRILVRRCVPLTGEDAAVAPSTVAVTRPRPVTASSQGEERRR